MTYEQTEIPQTLIIFHYFTKQKKTKNRMKNDGIGRTYTILILDYCESNVRVYRSKTKMGRESVEFDHLASSRYTVNAFSRAIR